MQQWVQMAGDPGGDIPNKTGHNGRISCGGLDYHSVTELVRYAIRNHVIEAWIRFDC
jgi:hypothetical protein